MQRCGNLVLSQLKAKKFQVEHYHVFQVQYTGCPHVFELLALSRPLSEQIHLFRCSPFSFYYPHKPTSALSSESTSDTAGTEGSTEKTGPMNPSWLTLAKSLRYPYNKSVLFHFSEVLFWNDEQLLQGMMRTRCNIYSAKYGSFNTKRKMAWFWCPENLQLPFAKNDQLSLEEVKSC